MTFIKNDNTPLRIIRAGNDNLFRSEVFGNTIATMIGQEIEIFNTTGAVGAARAASMDLSNMDLQSTQDYSSSYTPQKNKEVYLEAYSKWEKELKDIINKH